MSKKPSTSPENIPPDPEETAAEQHVTELMGPAWSGGTPPSEAPTEEPSVDSTNADGASPPPEPVSEAIEQVSVASMMPIADEQQIVAEPDLNMEVAPAEFDTPKTDEQIAATAVQKALTSEVTDVAIETSADTMSTSPVVMKESFLDRFKEGFYRWWDNKVARYVTLGVVFAVLVVIVAVPPVRIGLMNLLGLRASLSVYAVDATTLQPITGATLSAGDESTKTNASGKATLNGVKLGHQTVILRKAGFAEKKQSISFEFRAVDLGEIDMKATGLQVEVGLTDYLSGKPIEAALLQSGESSTKSDKTGKAVITLAPGSESEPISISKNGYRVEQLKPDSNLTAKKVKLVLAAKEIYIAKENGLYNLKKIDLDGKNDSVLLPGTGNELSTLGVSVDPFSHYAALISTRDNVKNKDGYLLSALTLVNISTGDSETIEHAEKLTVVGWSGTTLVYKLVVAGASAANASREKIMAYNYSTDKRYQIAAANEFVGAELQSGTLYYVVSSTDPNAKSGLMRAALDGSGKKLLQEADVWAAYRLNYKTLRLQTENKWYDYTVNGSVSEVKATTTVSRTYLDSNDAKLSAWSDASATNGTLSLYNIASGKEEVLTKIKGRYKPVRWLNNRVLIYREAATVGATDYVLNLDGGQAVKLADTYSF